jgi:flavin reductase (DIM6/NTAB) family NADH-FMN oxidoreductase RutF
MAVRRDSLPAHLISAAGCFAINFVSPERMDLLKELVKPASQVGDKLAGHAARSGETGAPLLECAVAWLECRVTETVTPGDHTLVIGEVVAAGRSGDERPLVLADTPWRYGG